MCLNKVERPREMGKSKREGGEKEDDKDVVVPVGGEGICWPARAHLLRGGMSVDESEDKLDVKWSPSTACWSLGQL